MATPLDPALVVEFDDLMTRYGAVWNSQDFAKLEEFWDKDASPLYLAEERDDFVVGWDALRTYFVEDPDQPSMVEALMMKYTVTNAVILGDELAQMVGFLRHDMKLRGPMKAWGGECRFTAVVRRRADGWRIVSYLEAHMTPLRYVQKLYEHNVSPDFEAFRENVVAERALRPGPR